MCPVEFQEVMEEVLLNEALLLRLMSCDYELLAEKIGELFYTY